MGQKVHPIGFRVGVIRTWESKWFEEKNYAKWLHEDLKIRKFVKEEFMSQISDEKGSDRKASKKNESISAGISRVEIERAANKVTVRVHTSRPGVLIGRKGVNIDKLRQELSKLTSSEVNVKIEEIRKPELDAQLVAENIATQLVRRVAFRRAMKKAVTTTMKQGAKGIRICCGGRLGGAEMARKEWYREGRVPLHTLRADIQYGFAIAHTAYGAIGVKVWIFKGEIIAKKIRK